MTITMTVDYSKRITSQAQVNLTTVSLLNMRLALGSYSSNSNILKLLHAKNTMIIKKQYLNKP